MPVPSMLHGVSWWAMTERAIYTLTFELVAGWTGMQIDGAFKQHYSSLPANLISTTVLRSGPCDTRKLLTRRR
jgi:hypothetical protein